MMRNCLLIIAFSSLALSANGAEKRPAFPDSISMRGVKYRFNQTFLEESLSRNVKQLKEELKKEASARDIHTVKGCKSGLALGLAAAAQFATMTPKLRGIIQEIADPTAPCLANETLPAAFLLPDVLLRGMAYEGFIDPDSQPPDTKLDIFGERNFGSLMIDVWHAIKVRGGIVEDESK